MRSQEHDMRSQEQRELTRNGNWLFEVGNAGRHRRRANLRLQRAGPVADFASAARSYSPWPPEYGT